MLKSPGLPDITGNIIGQQSGGISVWASAGEGALYVLGNSTSSPALAEASAGTISRMESGRLQISASRSNSIYSNSTTVQPPALQLIPQIRY